MREILKEGGLGGHMPHLYENGELTFAELKDALSAAAFGQLKGTEKTDGQNLKRWVREKEIKKLTGWSSSTIQTRRIKDDIKYAKIGGTIFYDIQDFLEKLEQSSI